MEKLYSFLKPTLEESEITKEAFDTLNPHNDVSVEIKTILRRRSSLLIEIAGDVELRTEFEKACFTTQELLWAFFRSFIRENDCVKLVEKLVKNGESELVFSYGLFENGIPSVDEPVSPIITDFIIKNKDFFSWQLLRDSFLERRSGLEMMKNYGLIDYFNEYVFKNVDGSEIVEFFKLNKQFAMPQELGLQQKTDIAKIFIKDSIAEHKIVFKDYNEEFAKKCLGFVVEVEDSLDREEYLEFLLMTLDKTTKHKDKVVKKITNLYPFEYVKDFFNSKTEYNPVRDRNERILMPSVLQEAYKLIVGENYTKEIKEGNFDSLDEISYIIGKRIPFDKKLVVAKSYLKKNSSDYSLWDLKELFSGSELKFYNAILRDFPEVALDFFRETCGEIKMPALEKFEILGLNYLSKLEKSEVLELYSIKKVSIKDILKDNNYMSSCFIEEIIESVEITSEEWSLVLKEGIKTSLYRKIPKEVLNKHYKRIKDESGLLKNPNLTLEQRLEILGNIRIFEFPYVLNDQISIDEIKVIFSRVEDEKFKDSVKNTYSKLLTQTECPEDIKNKVLEKILKSSNAIELLGSYVDLLDEKQKKKLQTSALKSKDQILSVLKNSADFDYKKRAINALVAHENDFYKFIGETEDCDILEVIKNIAIDKQLVRVACRLLAKSVSFKEELLEKIDFNNHGYYDSFLSTLNANECEILFNKTQTFRLNLIKKEVLEELAKRDSLAAALSFEIVQNRFPENLVKYLNEENVERIFKNLKPSNRFEIVKYLVDKKDGNLLEQFTAQEWAFSIEKGIYSIISLKSSINKQYDDWSKADVYELFNTVSKNDILAVQLMSEISLRVFGYLVEKEPKILKLHKAFTEKQDESTINEMGFKELVESSFDFDFINKNFYGMLKEVKNLEDVVAINPNKAFNIIKNFVPTRLIEVEMIPFLLKNMKEFDIEDFIVSAISANIHLFQNSQEELFVSGQFSVASQKQIADGVLKFVEKGRSVPDWLVKFIDVNYISPLKLFSNASLRGYFIDELKSPAAIEIAKIALNEDIEKIIEVVKYQYIDSTSLSFSLLAEYLVNKNIDQYSFSYKEGVFTVKIIGEVVIQYSTAEDKVLETIFNEETTSLVLDRYNKEINLPETVVGVFHTKTNEFITESKIAKKYKKFQYGESRGLSSEQLTELVDLGVDLELKGKLVKDFDYRSETFYSLIVEFNNVFENPIEKDIEESLEKHKGLYSSFQDHDKLIPISSRRWGFELEFSSSKPRTQLAPVFKKNGFNIDISSHYHSSDGKNWDFKQDSSVNSVNGGFTVEIASPILIGEEGIEEARKFLDLLFSSSVITTGEETSSGLHVHHEVKDIVNNKKQIAHFLNLLQLYQEPIYALCSEYRQDNTYCSKIYSYRIDEDIDFNHRDGFNFTSKGTLEFRMKESMSSTSPILRWIKITQKIVEDLALATQEQNNKFIDEVSKTIDLLEQEKITQLAENRLTEGLEQFMSAKRYSQILLSKKNKR